MLILALLLMTSQAAKPICVSGCGVERWAIKTGCDPQVYDVDLNHSIDTTVEQLRSLPVPNGDVRQFTSRVPNVEDKLFTVEAILSIYKGEKDKDDHLVIADLRTGGTMIVEIPDPDCVAPESPFYNLIKQARADFLAHFHVRHIRMRKNLKVKVRITGVGFFDVKHGQTGVAPNAIEIHPVLKIEFLHK